jgi:hypothetical protein
LLIKGERRQPWTDTNPSVDAWHLWIEFLKRVPVKEWSEKVRSDFEGADKMSTEDFYQQNAMRLFVGPSKELIVTPLRVGDIWDETRELALLINPDQPNDAIMDLVQRFVWLNRKEFKKGRPKFEPENARYPFCRPPDIKALEITLHIHDLMAEDLKKEKPELKLWQIMEATQTLFPILPNQKLKKTDKHAEQIDKKKVLNAAASRYLARAKKIKTGVANGIFPAE